MVGLPAEWRIAAHDLGMAVAEHGAQLPRGEIEDVAALRDTAKLPWARSGN